MMPALPAIISYESAKKALAELHRIDEVANIRNKAVAMQIYAQQAKDRALIEHATEVRMRAEIRAGELLAEMKLSGARVSSKDTLSRGSAVAPREAATLSDLGVTKKQSSRWQKLAGLTEDQREEKIEQAKAKAEAAVEPQAQKKSGEKFSALPKGTSDPVERFVTQIIWKIDEKATSTPEKDWPRLFAALRDRLDGLAIRYVGIEEDNNGHYSERQSA